LKKVEDLWKRKIEEKEKELVKILEKKEVENNVLIGEIRSLQGEISKLEQKVQVSEG